MCDDADDFETNSSFFGKEGVVQKECNEGVLEWIDTEELLRKQIWEGDRIFLKMLIDDEPFFSLKLSYKGDRLIEKKLNTYSFTL